MKSLNLTTLKVNDSIELSQSLVETLRKVEKSIQLLESKKIISKKK
jgi:hypothetical protein